MVDAEQVRGRPFPMGLAAFAPYNLKRNFCCRLAARAAGGHLSDNHKVQDPQAGIGRILQAGAERLVTPAKEVSRDKAPGGEPSECA